MICPHCGEESSLKDLLRLWAVSKVPYSWCLRLERYRQERDLDELIELIGKFSDLSFLTSREVLVVEARLGDKTFEEIAQRMNVTCERVRQIQAKAVRKLRKYENSQDN